MNHDAGLKRILIFDDDADFRKLLITYLGKLLEGVELEEYDPVARGVPGEAFDWSRYDVLILDYYLCINNVTGLDILQANRKNKFFPAAIMLTGAGNEETAVRALKAGVYDYLRKEKLDKQQLRTAILDAFEKHKSEIQRRNELTQQSNAFNKALFYQQLEQPAQGPDTVGRVLLLIELDDHELLEERLGIILRDNVVRHIARQSYEFFQSAAGNPHITRLSDHAVALLTDDPGSTDALVSSMGGLCQYLEQQPYRFEDKKFRFTVSTGVIPVPSAGTSADVLIRKAREACQIALTRAGNSFHIIEAPQPLPEAGRPAPPQAIGPGEAPVHIKVPDTQPGVAAAPAGPPARAQQKPGMPPRPSPVAAVPAGAPVPDIPKAAPASARPAATAARQGSKTIPGASSKAPAPVKPPATRPPQRDAAGAPAPAGPAATEEVHLDEAALAAGALRIKKAFNEKRIVQLFQPIISLVNIESDGVEEFYKVYLQLIDTDGSIVAEEAIYAHATSPVFRKFIDRWLLRETIGRIVGSKRRGKVFILRISEASLADPSLFNWLRKTLTGVDASRPGQSIALEIAAADFAAERRKAAALMTYLRNSHGFRFVLGNIQSADELKSLSGDDGLQMLRIGQELFSRIRANATEDDGAALFERLRDAGAQLIVDSIRDATTLTEAIAGGASYAMGTFVGEPTTALDETSRVESFEIA